LRDRPDPAMPDPNPMIETITSADPAVRDRSLRAMVQGRSTAEILADCEELEAFRRRATNLYERVRASLFLHALHRYALQEAPGLPASGFIPGEGVDDLMQRRFEQAISAFRSAMRRDGPSGTIASALAKAYEEIALQTLADQVRRSVRSCRGNRWMFRVGS